MNNPQGFINKFKLAQKPKVMEEIEKTFKSSTKLDKSKLSSEEKGVLSKNINDVMKVIDEDPDIINL